MTAFKRQAALRASFILVVLIAVLALAGGKSLAADAKPNEITAIDILLEPDATMIEHATATNDRLLKVFSEGLFA